MSKISSVLQKKIIIPIVSVVVTAVIITSLVIYIPQLQDNGNGKGDASSLLIPNTASTHLIISTLETPFGTYSPLNSDYDPSIIPTEIDAGLSNVDKQGLHFSSEVEALLELYGFALVDEGVQDIFELYNGETYNIPKFITTDLCLHTYHVLYDISLRILEVEHFFDDFETMLFTLRDSQINLKSTVSNSEVINALDKNIAYLSVMLYLLNETNPIPSEISGLVSAELDKIDQGVRAESSIFGYDEDFTQYKIRGHYTRNDILGNYFKAMMYAGRMSFLLQSPGGDPEMGIDHTRMAMLLISSFNTSIAIDTVWDYWDKLYQPTAFYVGACDDLTPYEYYRIWLNHSSPIGDSLADEDLILEIIEDAKNYRKPKINSMVGIVSNAEDNTQGFRLMGQRFIPDSYIFQQLVDDKVGGRLMPTGLDVFSVFGSPRADYYMRAENKTYSNYDDQIFKLRDEFGDLTDYDWTQNLYWLWLYSLFPLLEPASEGYPGFMLSDAWSDKALMTAMGSWAELRHDTILYAKQSYTLEAAAFVSGYLEPYPEVYARLASLVRLMQDGLDSRSLLSTVFKNKFESLAGIFDRFVEISIKELQNQPLNGSELDFINRVGETLGYIASFYDSEIDPYTSEADDRTAVIADVHTDPNSGTVLEVGVGNPYTIYVIVQDSEGNLKLTRGGTFSYYEFTQPMEDRLTDEQWQEMLDTTPPDTPDWMQEELHITLQGALVSMVISRKES